MAHPNKLANKRVAVFGGTSGIGFAVASLALSQGSSVIVSGSRQERVDTAIKRLKDAYPNTSAQVTGYPADLSDKANLDSNLKAFFDYATENGSKKLDHIAFTAGDPRGPPKVADTNLTLDILIDLATVRFFAPVMIAKTLATGDYIHKSPSSSVTLTTGVNGQRPFPGWALIAPWGTATEGLVRGLAVDLAPIRFNVVSPGAIDTELLKSYPKQISETFAKATLTKELGDPTDTAEAYAYCMRDRFVNGLRIDTNGGTLLVSPGALTNN